MTSTISAAHMMRSVLDHRHGARAIQGGKRDLVSCCHTSQAETAQFLHTGARQQLLVKIG